MMHLESCFAYLANTSAFFLFSLMLLLSLLKLAIALAPWLGEVERKLFCLKAFF